MSMAIRAQRSSALNFGTPFPVTIPWPDGDIDKEDRAHLMNTYALTPDPIFGSLQTSIKAVKMGPNPTGVIRI